MHSVVEAGEKTGDSILKAGISVREGSLGSLAMCSGAGL
jgi:hypothetical protein